MLPDPPTTDPTSLYEHRDRVCVADLLIVAVAEHGRTGHALIPNVPRIGVVQKWRPEMRCGARELCSRARSSTHHLAVPALARAGAAVR